MKRLFGTALIAAGLLLPGTAQAADYPTRPITIIAGFNAGGTSDMVLRAMAPELEKELGQPVLIVNKGGSGGALAIGETLTKKADGYTVCLTNSPALTLDLQTRKARYSIDDFTFLGSAGSPEEGFYSLPDKPWHDFASMVEYAKKEGKELTFSSPSIIDTLIMKAVSAKEGVKFRKVPMKSGGETVTAVLGGHVDFGHGGGIQAPYVEAGKMINLATTTTRPYLSDPECKPLVSLGYENTGYDNHYILYVLKDTPADICAKLTAAVDKVANSSVIQDVIANKAKMNPVILKAEEIQPLLKQQFEDYKALIAAGQ